MKQAKIAGNTAIYSMAAITGYGILSEASLYIATSSFGRSYTIAMYSTQATSSSGAQATENARRLGKMGEEATGIVKNTKRIESISGKKAYRIPDGLDEINKILTEVKNVKSQGFTSQIKDFLDWSIKNDYDFVLKTRADTVISKPLQTLIDSSDIIHKLLSDELLPV